MITLDAIYQEIGPDIPSAPWMPELKRDLRAVITRSTALPLAATGDLHTIRAFWMTLGPFVKRFAGYCYDAMSRFCLQAGSDPALRTAAEALVYLREDEVLEEDGHWRLFVKAGEAVGVPYHAMDRPSKDWLPELECLLAHFDRPPSAVAACLNFFATEMVAAAVCERLNTEAFTKAHGLREVAWVRVHLEGTVNHPERTWEHEELAYKLTMLADPTMTEARFREHVLHVVELFYVLGEAGLKAYA